MERSKEELKEYFFCLMDNAENIIELLLILGQYNIHLSLNYYTLRIKKFNENVERIAYTNALKHLDSIIDDLNNNISLDIIKDKYNVTATTINKILISLDRPCFDISELIKEEDIKFLCAKTMIRTLIDENVTTNAEIRTKFHFNIRDFKEYLNLLSLKKHSLYYEYCLLKDINKSMTYKNNVKKGVDKKRKEKAEAIEKYKNSSKTQLTKLVTDRTSISFSYLLSLGDFDPILLENILKMNKSLIYEFINNPSNSQLIYDYYVMLYKQVSKRMIRDICILNINGFKKPLDIYSYYENNYDPYCISAMAKQFGDIKNNTLILRYIEKKCSVFFALLPNNLETIRRMKVFTCCRESINFTSLEFDNAIRDLDEKNIPYMKGTLYYALKKQISLRNVKTLKKE